MFYGLSPVYLFMDGKSNDLMFCVGDLNIYIAYLDCL